MLNPQPGLTKEEKKRYAEAKGKYGAYCVNKCGMNVSRILGVALSDEQVKTLLSHKKILLKGLTSKRGKKYDPISFLTVLRITAT